MRLNRSGRLNVDNLPVMEEPGALEMLIEDTSWVEALEKLDELVRRLGLMEPGDDRDREKWQLLTALEPVVARLAEELVGDSGFDVEELGEIGRDVVFENIKNNGFLVAGLRERIVKEVGNVMVKAIRRREADWNNRSRALQDPEDPFTKENRLDPAVESYTPDWDRRFLQEAVEEALNLLEGEHAKDVVKLRFDFDGGAEKKQCPDEEIGEILGVARSQVHDIRRKALRALQSPSINRLLLPFDDVDYISEDLSKNEIICRILDRKHEGLLKNYAGEVIRPGAWTDLDFIEQIREVTLVDTANIAAILEDLLRESGLDLNVHTVAVQDFKDAHNIDLFWIKNLATISRQLVFLPNELLVAIAVFMENSCQADTLAEGWLQGKLEEVRMQLADLETQTEDPAKVKHRGLPLSELPKKIAKPDIQDIHDRDILWIMKNILAPVEGKSQR